MFNMLSNAERQDLEDRLGFTMLEVVEHRLYHSNHHRQVMLNVRSASMGTQNSLLDPGAHCKFREECSKRTLTEFC